MVDDFGEVQDSRRFRRRNYEFKSPVIIMISIPVTSFFAATILRFRLDLANRSGLACRYGLLYCHLQRKEAEFTGKGLVPVAACEL